PALRANALRIPRTTRMIRRVAMSRLFRRPDYRPITTHRALRLWKHSRRRLRPYSLAKSLATTRVDGGRVPFISYKRSRSFSGGCHDSQRFVHRMGFAGARARAAGDPGFRRMGGDARRLAEQGLDQELHAGVPRPPRR